LRERASKRALAGGAADREGEAAHLGLYPRTLQSQPEPKADAELIEPPQCPSKLV